jgi:arabinose-5-phosphate isomerase
MIVPGSCVIAISYSGESRELNDLLRYCASAAVPVIGMTRNPESTLGRLCSVHLPLPVVKESCPNGLAPTASTTMTMALGDALTIALMDRRGFSREDFGVRHPGGKLGKQLQTAGDYLRDRHLAVPRVGIEDSIHDVIVALAEGRLGCVAVVDGGGRYRGIITDGDLRRAITNDRLTAPAGEIMSADSTTFRPDQRMAEVVRILSERRIANGFVLHGEEIVGALHIKDLLAEGYI